MKTKLILSDLLLTFYGKNEKNLDLKINQERIHHNLNYSDSYSLALRFPIQPLIHHSSLVS